jgi:hypothetical protein
MQNWLQHASVLEGAFSQGVGLSGHPFCQIGSQTSGGLGVVVGAGVAVGPLGVGAGSSVGGMGGMGVPSGGLDGVGVANTAPGQVGSSQPKP